MRNYLFKIVAFLIVLVLAGCATSNGETISSSASEGSKTSQVRFGIDAGISTLPFRVSEEQGYFEKYSLEPTIASFAYGIDTINALFTEQTDTGFAADYALLNSLGKGDLVILGTITRGTEQSNQDITLLVNGNIQSAQDLKGKRLGVAKGTVYEYIWAKYLEKNKIAEKDIKFVPYSSPDEAIIGMKNGDIDAVWGGGALNEKFKSIEGVRQIDDLNGAGVSINLYLLANKSYVTKNPKNIENVLKALSEGIEYIQSNKKEAAKIAYKQIKLPEADVLRDLEHTNYVLGFTNEDVLHLEEMKEWLEKRGTLTDKYEVKEKLYIEPLRNALPEAVTYEE
ncbi:sulfonate ABC transporter substrate-binding protein [Bacillus sp. 7586-K]|uniref:ABC-type nitrate/sulfonate/bicarbonate transport system substrate-binding protein n=1 Tax=Metabacillus niabensis TaxID=324854 RepID=A0ABT9YY57_9BACI|nr:ABC transporter substrate-binding protein [Metabacillus niabensis]MDQ0224000.1 ABC-type nitrate/sulfonate/bicarbonate transport system substrate-binding protein [Metabacillus niabensis]PAD70464.1 sulfonate ABC transporter substrate-binding protein [Bacillus sp. 7586-K]